MTEIGVKMEAVEREKETEELEEPEKMEEDEEMEVDIAEIPELRASVGLCGFMELVFHHLMYVKNVYPKEAFKRCVRKNVPIWMCEHPGVTEYIINFLDFANKLLMKTKKLKICFVLCRRNKEVIEEFYFELKIHNMFVESESKLVCLVDNLVSICEDIQKTNTFTGFNTMHSGAREITFELQILLNPPVELPEQSPDYRWVVCYAPEGEKKKENPLKKVTPLKEERNKTYEVKAYACRKE